MLLLPFTGKYQITDDFTAHLARKSKAPGVDFALPAGTPVLAAADGCVHCCEWSERGGRYLLLRHASGVMTLYSHLHALLVAAGERVKAGQQIATSGNTGFSTGPHLHFAVKVDGKWVDPAQWLPEHDN